MMPFEALEHAIKEACKSPCLSKRGVVIFWPNGSLLGRGHNHQPAPFMCTGDAACKANCGKSAIHAEQQAILNALNFATSVNGASLLHVKVKEGQAVYSGPPSCLECSKLILAADIGDVWLLHNPIEQQYSRFGEMRHDGLTRYTAEEFHRATCQHHGISLVQCPYEEYVEAL